MLDSVNFTFCCAAAETVSHRQAVKRRCFIFSAIFSFVSAKLMFLLKKQICGCRGNKKWIVGANKAI